MSHQLGSELLKLRTTRTMPLLLLAAAAFTLFGAAVEGVSGTTGELAGTGAQRELFGAGISGVIFATLAGILVVTTEFRYGTIHPTLLTEPRRGVVLGAKLVAAALTGLGIAAACLAVAYAAGFAILAARGVDAGVSGSQTLIALLGTMAASALGALLGVAIGTLIRNQSGSIAALAGYALVVDAVLFAAIPSVGRYLPGKAGDGLADRPVDDLLAPGLGAAVLAAWTLAFVVAAWLRNDRSDV